MTQDATPSALTPYYWDKKANAMRPFTGNYKNANGFINIAAENTEDVDRAIDILVKLSKASTNPDTQYVCILPKNVEFSPYLAHKTQEWASHGISIDHAPQEGVDSLTGMRQWFEANEARRATSRNHVRKFTIGFRAKLALSRFLASDEGKEERVELDRQIVLFYQTLTQLAQLDANAGGLRFLTYIMGHQLGYQALGHDNSMSLEQFKSGANLAAKERQDLFARKVIEHVLRGDIAKAIENPDLKDFDLTTRSFRFDQALGLFLKQMEAIYADGIERGIIPADTLYPLKNYNVVDGSFGPAQAPSPSGIISPDHQGPLKPPPSPNQKKGR